MRMMDGGGRKSMRSAACFDPVLTQDLTLIQDASLTLTLFLNRFTFPVLNMNLLNLCEDVDPILERGTAVISREPYPLLVHVFKHNQVELVMPAAAGGRGGGVKGCQSTLEAWSSGCSRSI